MTDHLDESGPTKKHFAQVANTVRAIADPAERQKFSDHHASIFSSQNPRFDHAKWHAAAGTKTQEERNVQEGTEPMIDDREDEETLDELSKGSLNRYREKARGFMHKAYNSTDNPELTSMWGVKDKKAERKISNRASGIRLASNRLRKEDEETFQEGEETATVMDSRAYAAALAAAALTDKPQDVADIFHDALQAKVAEMVLAYKEQLINGEEEDGEEETNEGMVCKDTGDDDKGGDDDGDKKDKKENPFKKKEKDDGDKDDDDGDKEKKDDDDGDKKKPSFLKK